MKTKQNKNNEENGNNKIRFANGILEWSLSTFKYDRIFYSTFKKSINSA